MSTGLRVRHVDSVRVVHMEFGAANALGPQVVEALLEELGRAPLPTVLTGEGKVFSAGLNLVALESYDREALSAFVDRFSAAMLAALTAPYPLVAAVNGHAVAGGCVLAMACDERIGTYGAFKIGMNEMAIGLTLPAVVTEIIRGKLSPEHSHTVILGGALYSPEQARQVGLLDDIAEDAGAAVERACVVAARLGRSMGEFAAMKAKLLEPIVQRYQESRVDLDRAFLDSWYGEAAKRTRHETVERLRSRSSAG